MLSPLGTLLVNQRDQEYNLEYDNKFEGNLNGCDIPCNSAQDVNNAQTPLPYTHDGDLEDAIAKEMPRNNVDSAIIMQGHKTSKSKALHH